MVKESESSQLKNISVIMETNDVVWLTFIAIGWIFGIVQIYGLYFFYSIKHLSIVKKRYWQIVFVEALITICFTFIGIPFGNATHINVPFLSKYQFYFNQIGWFCIAYFPQALCATEASRLWLIYFDLNYLHSLKNSKWKSIINKTEQTNNWYLNKRNIYGNMRWITTFAFVYWLVAASITFCLYLVFGASDINFVRNIEAFFTLIPIATIIILCCKCPKNTKDAFLFRFEFRMSVLFFLGTFAISFVAGGIGMFGLWQAIESCMKLIVSLCPISASLLSTLWISHKISSKEEWRNDANYPKKNEGDVMRDIVDNESGQLPIKEQLINTLANEQEFESFMEHIFNEFSSEILLCFVECNQYKQLFVNSKLVQNIDTNTNGDSTGGGELYKYYALYSSIPPSSIVYEHGNESDSVVLTMKKCAYALYTKYIEVGSYYEINISSPLRDKYIDLMQDSDAWLEENGNEEENKMAVDELIGLFDPILEEMFHLMTQIYVRYIFK